jgi:hypothetical protein
VAELTAHEKFLQGVPLNEELAAVREGKEPQTTAAARNAAAQRRAHDDDDRGLTRAERLDLKEFREMPGWELFLRIADKCVRLHQKRAISLSQDDPLVNRDAIASAWAYVKILRRAVAELEAIVNAEVEQLETPQ